MHSHYADFVARDFHVAFHFGVCRAQPRHETLQGGGPLAFIAQRKFEKFIERVIGLRPQPRENACAAAVAAQQPGIEREGRFLRKSLFVSLQPIQG